MPESDEAQFNSDTTERDKGRTDLPWQTDETPEDPAVAETTGPTDGDAAQDDAFSPVPVPAHREDSPPPPKTYGDKDQDDPSDILGQIHGMISEIHSDWQSVKPIIEQAKQEFADKGVSGFMQEMVSSLFKFGK